MKRYLIYDHVKPYLAMESNKQPPPHMCTNTQKETSIINNIQYKHYLTCSINKLHTLLCHINLSDARNNMKHNTTSHHITTF